MKEQEQNENRVSKSEENNMNKEVDLMKYLRKTVAIRKTLYKAAGLGLVIGIIISLSIPKQYTVKVTLSPEINSSKGNNGLAGLAASFLGSNVAMGENSDALNAFLSADIVTSTPFLLELFDVNVPISGKDRQITVENYLDEYSIPWWKYIISSPSFVVSGIKSLFKNPEDNPEEMSNGIIELSQEKNDKIKLLKENIIASVDDKNLITHIFVTLQDPRIAAVVADSVISKLQDYIINYRTSKAKDDCLYLEKLFNDRQQEYYVAQKKYAEYIDTHDNLILQSVRTEQERLQNDMSIAYQVYSQVANQLQVARAKVQEEKPVFAVIEPAVVPLEPSNMGIKVYMVLFMFLSIFCVIGWVLIGKDMWNKLISDLKGGI